MASPSDHISAFVQTAYIVEDAKASAEIWAKTFGAGPFFVLENIKPDTLGGTDSPTSLDHTSAYGQLGGEMVELVQPNNGRASVFDWDYDKLHHRAAFAHDYDAALVAFAALGMPKRASAAVNGMPFCFVDCLSTLGHFVELYPASDRLTGFYSMVADAAKDWDGSDPVRILG